MESAMRECLSNEAWCDVRLSCGGRLFKAHRVVLSSVSPFLRVLLQSRPDEDVPTTIVIPDVDVEAMSAVLHYIYNGQVSLSTHHLDDFFNIVKTLQICVDKKSLIAFREKIEDFDTKILDIEAFKKIITSRGVPIVINTREGDASIVLRKSAPEVIESKQLDLEHVLKGDRICKSSSPYRTDDGLRLRTDLGLFSRTERQQRPAASIHDPDDSNRRDSPQLGRDSPPRGLPTPSGCNGPATCVPAITSDHNLRSKSSPVTNEAVGWRTTSPTDASEISHRRMRHRDGDAAVGFRRRTECAKNSVPNITFRNDLCQSALHSAGFNPATRLRDQYSDGHLIDTRISKNQTTESIRKPAVLRPVPTLLPIGPMYNLPPPPPPPRVEHGHGAYFRPPPDLLDLSSDHLARFNIFRTTSREGSRTALLSTHHNGYAGSQSIQSDVFTSSCPSGSYMNDGFSRLSEGFGGGHGNIEEVEHDSSRMRRTAYNKVLANPWCPRLLPTYRPPQPSLPRHDYTGLLPIPPQLPPLSTSEQEMKEQLSPASSVVVDEFDDKCSNDDNNNVRDVSASPPVTQPTTVTSDIASSVPVVTSHSIDAIIGKDFGGPAMRCATCDKVFTCRATLATHVRAHAAAASARHTCPDCGKSFSQLRNFKYHVSVHRGTREFAATCNVCGKYFNDRGYLSSHMKIHRNRKEYECPHCPKSFNQRVAYNMHVRIHTGVKPHVCAECGKAFSRKMLLKQHQRTHSGERPYACSVCDKRFADRSNMTLHMRLHSGVKPFSCNLCPKSFTKKHHLKTHLNYHTGDKPYSCPRCQLAFSQSSNMRTHLKKCGVNVSGSPITSAITASVVAPT